MGTEDMGARALNLPPRPAHARPRKCRRRFRQPLTLKERHPTMHPFWTPMPHRLALVTHRLRQHNAPNYSSAPCFFGRHHFILHDVGPPIFQSVIWPAKDPLRANPQPPLNDLPTHLFRLPLQAVRIPVGLCLQFPPRATSKMIGTAKAAGRGLW